MLSRSLRPFKWVYCQRNYPIRTLFTEEVGNVIDFHKIPRIFVPQLTSTSNTIVDDDLTHYISTVMRLKDGNMVRAFNPQHGEYMCNIEMQQMKKKIVCSLHPSQRIRQPDDCFTLPCTLLFSPIKKDRLKVMLEKATELGISEMIPIVTQNTNHPINDSTYKEQLNKILIQSSEQCERLSIPQLYDQITFGELMTFLSCRLVSPISHSSAATSNRTKLTDGNNKRNNKSKHNEKLLEKATSGVLTSHNDTILLVCRERDVTAEPLLNVLLRYNTQYGRLQTEQWNSINTTTQHTNNIVSHTVESFNGVVVNNDKTTTRATCIKPKIFLLVGPEGGFTQSEFKQLAALNNCNDTEGILQDSINSSDISDDIRSVSKVAQQQRTRNIKVQFVSLGHNVLRAETAVISALSIVSAVCSMKSINANV